MCFEGVCEKASCFPGSATVRLQDGSRKPLAALRPGRDVIQTVDAEGKVQYETYLMDFHGRTGAWATYMRITHEAGGSLEVSPNHLLFVPGPEAGARVAVRASVLGPGDRLFLVAEDSEGGGGTPLVRPVSITAVEEVKRRGAFAPLTLSGRLVVDGVAASAYAFPWPEPVVLEAELKYPILQSMVQDAHSIIHAVTLPLRWGAAAWAVLVQNMPSKIQSLLDRPETLPEAGMDLHWYAEGAKKIFEDAVLSHVFGREKFASMMDHQCP